jgi:predicted Na+-dependent transporter
MVFIVIVLIAAGLYTLGWVLGKSLESKKTLAITMGHKNISLCIWLALSNFDPLAAIPPTAYIITQHIFNSLLIFIFSRQDKG